MELGISLIYDFPVKALPELRGVRIEVEAAPYCQTLKQRAG